MIVVNKVAMEQIIANNNNIILLLLEEEEEEEVNRYNLLLTSKRNSINTLFTTRVEEGFFEVLIKGHLNDNKKKFRDFFRLNYDQFIFIPSLIKDDISLPPSNRVKKPITADEKLAVTLR